MDERYQARLLARMSARRRDPRPTRLEGRCQAPSAAVVHTMFTSDLLPLLQELKSPDLMPFAFSDDLRHDFGFRLNPLRLSDHHRLLNRPARNDF